MSAASVGFTECVIVNSKRRMLTANLMLMNMVKVVSLRHSHIKCMSRMSLASQMKPDKPPMMICRSALQMDLCQTPVQT